VRAGVTPLVVTASPDPQPRIVETPVAPISEQEEIARLAFSYWEARGCQGGSPEEDWARAEREVRSRSAK
jgi:hypothetical protein